MRNSVVSASECCKRNAKRLSSKLAAWKITLIIGKKSKLDSALLIRWLRVLLLRHVALMRE
jgi:hypothetical protein